MGTVSPRSEGADARPSAANPAAGGFEGGFGGLGGLGGLGAGAPPNPEAMRAMLNNPFVQSQLDALLNENPEALASSSRVSPVCERRWMRIHSFEARCRIRRRSDRCLTRRRILR